MDFSHHLNLPFLLPNQAQKHVTVNESLLALDAIVQLSVVSQTLTVPPGTLTEGEAYIPASGASGAWLNRDGQIAVIQDGAWHFYTPQTGWVAWSQEDNGLLAFDGSAWIDVSASLTATPTLGINGTADETNRLLVKSDAILFDNDGSNQQVKVNKATTGDTATLLFQSGFTGHAEMGLAGNNDFSIKVSPDGSAFTTALIAKASNGRLGVGTSNPASTLHVQQDFDGRLTIETTSSGSGGGFDILNSTDNQNWRVTGTQSVFKIRDHTAGLDKILFYGGANGRVNIVNAGNVGIGVNVPTAKLHVEGTVRLGQVDVSGLPSASSTGAGTLIYVSDAAGGAVIAFSDGTNWRRMDSSAIVS